MNELKRYHHVVYDSARWAGFAFRSGDVVISTPPKCGTTWMQTLCAMLVLDTVEFDRPLAQISPWLDMMTNDLDAVLVSLEAQDHRRVIKTHTPLDGLPFDPRVLYLCVGRDPRDVALSFEHHMANLDMEAFMAARSAAVGLDDLAELGPPPPPPPTDAGERFRLWMNAEPGWSGYTGPNLGDILHHVGTFWDRRTSPNIALFHYSDLLADLPRELRRLSELLEIVVTDERLEQYAVAGTFESMKHRADDLVPDGGNRIWRSNHEFFHRGRHGEGRELLDDDALRLYADRVAELAPADLADWVHNGWNADATRSPATPAGHGVRG
jgi:aryl sulfotransferase